MTEEQRLTRIIRWAIAITEASADGGGDCDYGGVSTALSLIDKPEDEVLAWMQRWREKYMVLLPQKPNGER